MSEHDPGTDPAAQGTDPAEQEHVRALLAELGRTAEPVPPDVAQRLDDALAGLVAERGTSAPVVPLGRARQRRRRGLQTLVAAAAVVVGGYAVSQGVLTTSGSDDAGGSATEATDEDSVASGDAGGAAPTAGAFAMASGTLRADARRLLDADRSTLLRGQGYLADPQVPLAGESARAAQDGQGGEDPRGPEDDELDAGEGDGLDDGLDAGAEGVPLPARGTGCLDPRVPARLPRFAVTYDGRAATAVVRALRPAAPGADRVRVEVWDCTSPARLAVVVVRP